MTGFTCETLEEMIQSVRHVSVVDRKACRRAFDKRFTTQRMVKAYLKVYEQLLGIPAQAAPVLSDHASEHVNAPILSDGEISGIATPNLG